ncbi:G-protein coupled receptor 4-like, partial [Poecilia latipinna]|uniref:G-protein coupled receptor 4-like n=1 Tax=Poecilia latipinna TaxID=48699 RepID=UPI00072EE2BD
MSLNNSDTHDGYNNDIDYEHLLDQIRRWVNWITIGIGLPLILIVMIAVVFQVKKGQDAPVYVINLLVSDLIQLCCRMSSVVNLFRITFYAVLVSVGFMVCISCERYLVIAKPLWYRFRRNIKTYVVVCSLVWILPVVFLIMIYVAPGLPEVIICTVFLLLPFPLFIFFLVGTIKSLSGALRVPADEKRRIVAIQAVVLLNYTLLYLPIIILFLSSFKTFHIIKN